MLTLKVFFRSLRKRKAFSLITIGGYSIGLAVLFIMVSFIINEKSINRCFENRENIYRIVRSDAQPIIESTQKDKIQKAIPGIEKMCLYNLTGMPYVKEGAKGFADVIATDDDFLDIFSFSFIYQATKPTLSVKDNVILTESFSRKLYGVTNPVGNTIHIMDRFYTVVGVVTDVPRTASFRFDLMLCKDIEPAVVSQSENNESTFFYSFILLNKKVDLRRVEQQISEIRDYWIDGNLNFSLEPLSAVYFNTIVNDKMEHANVSVMYLLLSIALVIFLMTIFNYTNLTIASRYERLTEIGIKKATGASSKNILWQILNEAMVVSLFAMLIAVLIAYLIAPLFSELLNKKIELSSLLSQPMIVLAWILLLLITGLLSGVYPALVFSKVIPIQIIFHNREVKRNYKKGGMVIVQFIVTTCLVISLLFIHKQLKYVKYSDLGFDQELLRVSLYGFSKTDVFKDELLKDPSIVSVSASKGSPMEKGGTVKQTLFAESGLENELQYDNIEIDEDFVNTLDLKIIKGRNLLKTGRKECLINEKLFNELGGEDVVGQMVGEYEIVGVVKNFNYENLYSPIKNLVLQKLENDPDVLNIKIRGDIASTLESIKKTYSGFKGNSTMYFKFYDDWIQSLYSKEETHAKAIGLFALIAIIISCLGLIGIIEQTTHKKIKEIGIRKINGAKVSEILTMLNRDFVKWVVIAFIIATPISWYAMNKWLESFAYKTSLSWWIFALAGLLALGIALLTVSWQSWKAATRNPVEALRHE